MSEERHDSLTARMTVVESTVERLERTVNSMASSMQRYIEEQARSPRPIPFKEIMLTAAATLTVFYGIVQFFEQRIEANTSKMKYQIELLERNTEKRAEKPAAIFIRPMPSN